MERVFYFSGYRMTVFDWDGTDLFGSRDFQPDDAGFAEFEKLLKTSVNIPARLLVDMIEEDFRRESIPHVNFLDRRSLIDRQLQKHYREEDYVHARLIGRSKIGRKDDQVLLSALTNTGLLAPWLERLEEHDVRLAGIWSLPLLTEKLIRPMQSTEEHVLIVSRQVRSALRNTYLNNGKLLLSRQAKFDKDMWDREDFEGVMSNLERGTEEVYNFLLNQRMMSGSEKLHVHCIVNRDQLDEAELLSHPTDQVVYDFIPLEGLFESFGLTGCDGAGADALFSYLCTRKNPLYDHYAKDEQKATYYQYLVDRFVRNVTEIGSLVFVGAAVLLALKGMELDMQQENVTSDIAQLQMESDARFGDIQGELNNAGYVYDAVRLVEDIARDADQAPHQYFGALASVLSQPRYRPIQLLQMEWQKHTALEVQQLVHEHRSSLQTPDPNDPFGSDDVYFDDIPGVRQSTLLLRGNIKTSSLTYRETIAMMDDFVKDLEALDEIEVVLLVKTAADVRETQRFTDQIGRENSHMEAATNPFEIIVVVEKVVQESLLNP